MEGLSIQDKVTKYNAANREVAILCNHQKTVSKAAENQLENLNEKLATLKEQRNQMIEWRDLAKKGNDHSSLFYPIINPCATVCCFGLTCLSVNFFLLTLSHPI